MERVGGGEKEEKENNNKKEERIQVGKNNYSLPPTKPLRMKTRKINPKSLPQKCIEVY